MSLHPIEMPSSTPTARAIAAQRSDLRIRRIVVFAFLTAASVAVFAVSASGQGFEQMKMHEKFADPKIVKQMEAHARNYAGTGDANEVFAKVYFSSYVPAKITQFNALPELNGLVKNATTLLNRAQRSNNPRADNIRNWVYSGMRTVALGNYYPPARINALLVLGRLDQANADQISQTPPTPDKRALPILVSVYKNEANADGIRAAALKGIHRYVRYGLTRLAANEKSAIQGLMTELLAAEAPEGRGELEHAFLQRYAIDVLDLLRAKDDSALGVQLVSISTEPKSPDLLALHSVVRLGGMSTEMAGKVADPNKLVNSWSQRVIKTIESEIDRLNGLERAPKARTQPPRPEDFLNDKRVATAAAAAAAAGEDEGMGDMARMMGMGGDEELDEGEDDMMDDMAMMRNMGMMGAGGMGEAVISNPQPPEVIASRRRINSVLQMVHVGVTGSPSLGMPRVPGGVLAMTPPEARKEIEQWVTDIEPIVVALNEKTLDDQRKYLEALAIQLELLKELAPEEEPGLQPPAAEGEAPAGEKEPDELEALLTGG